MRFIYLQIYLVIMIFVYTTNNILNKSTLLLL